MMESGMLRLKRLEYKDDGDDLITIHFDMPDGERLTISGYTEEELIAALYENVIVRAGADLA